MTPVREVVEEAVASLAPIVEGATMGVTTGIVLSAAPTAPAALAVVLVALVVAMTRGRRVAITTAISADYVFGDHHLAGVHGIFGTPASARMFSLVLAVAVGVGMAGDRWWRASTQRG